VSKKEIEMKRSVCVILLLSLIGTGVSGPMWVRIHLNNPEEVKGLIQKGIDDIARVEPHHLFVEAVVPQSKKQILEGYRYEILDEDLSATWQRWQKEGVLVNFGPYYTYDEMQAQLDSIHQQYPDITTAKFSIGQSWFGRDIWAIKISDNPDLDEDEPSVLIDGVHHAREPISCTIPIEFAKYLCENYGNDPDITWLVNNREIYLLPVMNPDGYVYNESGDGYWRKNLRDNNNNGYVDDCDGVDPNRNYGYMWGYDNTGSSPDPCDQTYRGPSAFSEPENQAMRYFVDSIQPTIVINYHSYSNMIIYPWGYVDQPTPDEDAFVAMAQIMRASNGYTYGRPAQLLYPVNGEANDWMYGEQSEKPRAYSFVVEVGESFWQPDSATIAQQVAENIPMDLFVTRASGLYLAFNGSQIRDLNGELPDPGDTITIVLNLRNLCPADSGMNVTGILSSTTPGVTVIEGTKPFSDIGPFPDGYGSNSGQPFLVYLDPSMSPGTHVEFQVDIQANGGSYEKPVFFFTVVGIQPGFSDDVESGQGYWTHGGGNDLWHITEHRSNSPSHSWYCGQEGSWQYTDNMNAWLLSEDIALYPESKLVFWTYYELETGYDYGYVEVSADGGSTWQQLGDPFNGSSGGWVRIERDLRNFSGVIKIRFRLTSDGAVTREGWYVDDISVEPWLYPDIEVSPLTLNVTLPPDTIDTLWMTISNVGEASLLFTVRDTEWQVGEILLRKVVGDRTVIKRVRPHYEPAKGEPDPGRGVSPAKGQGGPDNYGYTWIDSDEPGGPVYDWVEISGVGTPLNFDDDDSLTVSLPFTFNFYGEAKNSVKISSNGYLTFGIDGADYSNDPIPDPDDPNDYIGPFWDDLNPTQGGQVYYYYDEDNNRFIVEWKEVPHYYNSGSYTFEAILYPDGHMLYQYNTMDGDLTSATVGIENGDGSDGLEVVYNASYVHDGLAVWLGLNLGWLTEDPASGTVEVGESMDVGLVFNTAEMDTGQYGAIVRVMSNDPDESVVNVEVSLTVGAGFIVGDVNGDGEVDYTDLIYLANFLFAGGPAPQPMASGDLNGDGDVSYTDMVMLANEIYGLVEPSPIPRGSEIER